jgi:hypothetical protein
MVRAMSRSSRTQGPAMIKNSFIGKILIDGREVYKPLQPTVPSVARKPFLFRLEAQQAREANCV